MMGDDMKRTGRPFTPWEKALLESIRELKDYPKRIDEKDISDIMYGLLKRTEGPTVTPEDIQDGKRYRVTVDGEGSIYTDDTGRRKFLVLSYGESPEEMNMFELENVTRIEKIGGDS